MAKKKRSSAAQISTAVVGSARAKAVEAGATPVMLRNGGARVWTAKNGRAAASRSACRQPVTDW